MQLSKIFSPTKKCKRKMPKNRREEMKWMQKDWPSCCWTIDKRIRIRPAGFFASVYSSIVRWEVGNRKEMQVVATRSFVFHAAAPWVYASSQPWITFTGIQFNWVRETPICQHIENSNLSNSLNMSFLLLQLLLCSQKIPRVSPCYGVILCYCVSLRYGINC